MDAFYKLLDRAPGLSLVDTGLILCIFLLLRQRVSGVLEDLRICRKRITRLERACLSAGIQLWHINKEG